MLLVFIHFVRTKEVIQILLLSSISDPSAATKLGLVQSTCSKSDTVNNNNNNSNNINIVEMSDRNQQEVKVEK